MYALAQQRIHSWVYRPLNRWNWKRDSISNIGRCIGKSNICCVEMWYLIFNTNSFNDTWACNSIVLMHHILMIPIPSRSLSNKHWQLKTIDRIMRYSMFTDQNTMSGDRRYDFLTTYTCLPNVHCLHCLLLCCARDTSHEYVWTAYI